MVVRMIRKIVRALLLGCVVLMLLALAAVSVAGKWESVTPLVIGLSVLCALYSGLNTGTQRRRELARGTTAAPASAGAGPIFCYHLLRGTGTLFLDDKGTLQFLADPEIHWQWWWWPPRALRRRSQAERSVTIPRDRLRAAVPFDNPLYGPSVVVGHDAPGDGLSWDEFTLATLPQSWGVAVPTGDAPAWARTLDPGVGAPDLHRAAVCYRTRLHRRWALCQLRFITLIMAAVYAAAFGLFALGAADKGVGTILGVVAVGGAVWLVTALICGAIILLTSR
jgi:hypothetical protein